jgi:hypothetical protein
VVQVWRLVPAHRSIFCSSQPLCEHNLRILAFGNCFFYGIIFFLITSMCYWSMAYNPKRELLVVWNVLL